MNHACPRCWHDPCICEPEAAEDDGSLHHFKCERCWHWPCTCPGSEDPDRPMHLHD